MAALTMEQQLLLCCRLGQTVRPLSRREYLPLAQSLRFYPDIQLNWDTLRALGYERDFCLRVLQLLDRREQLMTYLQAAPLIRLTWPGHVDYPLRLEQLGEAQPAVLFCKGEPSFLCEPAIAVVGARDLHAENAGFARAIGQKTAEEGFCLVSGNARGADLAAQEACLASGGRVIAFVPDSLLKYPERENVLYVSDEGYDCFFTSARALRRNTYIHALGRLCFAAQCTKTEGGTWQGSLDNLRHGRSRLFAYDDGSKGAKALQAQGAVLLREPPESLRDLLCD